MERDFYAQATREVPDGKVVLSNYGRFESVYAQNVAKTVAPGDYTVPLKNSNTMCKQSSFFKQFQSLMSMPTILSYSITLKPVRFNN